MLTTVTEQHCYSEVLNVSEERFDRDMDKMDIDDTDNVKPMIITAVIVLNVILNSIVIAVIARYPQLREDRTTLFMFSLILSDLANACTAMPIGAVLCSSAMPEKLKGNIFLPKMNALCSVWFTVTSMHSVCGVTICKMVAITNPLRCEQVITRNRCYITICGIWFIGALMGAIMAYYAVSWDGTACMYTATNLKINIAFVFVILAVTILCPFVGQIYSTARIVSAILRTHRQIAAQVLSLGSERNSVASVPSLTLKTVRSGRNVLIICLAFVVLTIPLIIYAAMALMGMRYLFPLWFNFFVIWTFTSNTFVNSLIYIFVFRSVRNKTAKMFGAICEVYTRS